MGSYFLDFWKRIGFSLASSSFLAKRMVSFLDSSHSGHIIELGAGNGVVTAEIIKKIHKDVQLDVFEIDTIQAEHLRSRFSSYANVTVHDLSAADISTIFPPGSIDAVISTLPLGSIPTPEVDHILRAISKVLKNRGQYIQYQYWMVNRQDVKRYFTIESTAFEPRNFGPAWIYRARK